MKVEPPFKITEAASYLGNSLVLYKSLGMQHFKRNGSSPVTTLEKRLKVDCIIPGCLQTLGYSILKAPLADLSKERWKDVYLVSLSASKTYTLLRSTGLYCEVLGASLSLAFCLQTFCYQIRREWGRLLRVGASLVFSLVVPSWGCCLLLGCLLQLVVLWWGYCLLFDGKSEVNPCLSGVWLLARCSGLFVSFF